MIFCYEVCNDLTGEKRKQCEYNVKNVTNKIHQTIAMEFLDADNYFFGIYEFLNCFNAPNLINKFSNSICLSLFLKHCNSYKIKKKVFNKFLGMIIFLYGEDTYRLREKLKEAVERYKKIRKSGLNLKHLDFSLPAGRQGDKQPDKLSFFDFEKEFCQTSMFKEKRLVILNNPLSSDNFKENFLEKGKNFLKSDDIILFCQEEKFNKNNSLFNFLKKNAKCQEFSPLQGLKLKNWVKKELDKYQTKIEPLALEKLIEYTGNDLWRLNNEIKKLINFKNRKEIKQEDVKLLVRQKIETDIFRTIDAIAQKNKKQALDLLHKHLEKGDSPLYLLTMINYQFRNLLIIKDLIEKRKPYDVILKASGLHPFVARKGYFQSQKFDIGELKKIYRKIFQVDLDIKTGRLNPETALDLLIAEI